MHEDKLKEEIFGKLRELGEVVNERDEIEEEPDFPRYSEIIEDEELTDEYIDYLGLCSKEMDLVDEVRMLMLETKYVPLTDLTNNQIKKLTFYVKSAKQDVLKEKIGTELDIRLARLREEIKCRQGKIKPPPLNIDLRVKHLYQEVIRSFVYSAAFAASCALCRAVAEFIAKEYIKSKGVAHLLPSEEQKREGLSILQILIRLSVDQDVIDLYSTIKEKANNILHEGAKKTEEDEALETIQLLQSFIEKFPRGK